MANSSRDVSEAMGALHEELEIHKIDLQCILEESRVLVQQIRFERIYTYDRIALISLMEARCVQLDAVLEHLHFKRLKVIEIAAKMEELNRIANQ
ncbi:unnamed protein product [Acanthocheilonema viteae]|uniref:Uncharacterized protein n=1 Tax=Acanthocheilonema viteae TaxID=6277 RepID=A0A498T268_ACAVI|nr:unnamed protein product [Acanthocheilonema viteae]